jgi:cytochrome P450
MADLCSRLNANTIPIAAWALMEIIQDRDLWKEVQEEADSAFEIDPATGERTLNVQKLLGLPLLQSIYVETLRLHVSVNVTREVVTQTATIAGYELQKHSFIQAPTRIALYNERAWGIAGHAASEFWAYRHIKYNDVQDESGKVARKPEFAMAAGPNDFFPYGMLWTGPVSTSK